MMGSHDSKHGNLHLKTICALFPPKAFLGAEDTQSITKDPKQILRLDFMLVSCLMLFDYNITISLKKKNVYKANNVVIISSTQQRDSVIHILVSILLPA